MNLEESAEKLDLRPCAETSPAAELEEILKDIRDHSSEYLQDSSSLPLSQPKENGYHSYFPTSTIEISGGSNSDYANFIATPKGELQSQFWNGHHEQAQRQLEPFLLVLEQPVERCRFRYKAEQGPHGSLKSVSGKKQRSCPKVKIENFHGSGYVVASLYTNEPQSRLHVNDLWGTHCQNGVCTIELDCSGIAAFPNLGIMRQKEKEIADVLLDKYVKDYQRRGQALAEEVTESLRDRANRDQITMKDCLHSVRIGFQGFLTDPSTGQQIITPLVLSDPVYNSQNPGFTELRIAEIDRSHGSCLGGDTIWMRCAAKVRRDQIRVKFREPSTGWEADGIFTSNEVYEQILIIFKTPAYRDPNIRDRVHVNLHLYRSSDGEYSPPMDFVYMPLDDDSSTGGMTEMQKRRLQSFSLDQLKSMISENASVSGRNKLMSVMTELWNTHLDALWQFSSEGDPQSLVAACRQLIGYQEEDGGNTALHAAVRSKQSFALRTLLTVLESVKEKPTIINAQNIRGQTALHLAVRYSDADSVHYLITSGAERSLADREGNTAIHYLADTFNEAIYKDVLFPPDVTVAAKQHNQLDLLNNAGHSPVHLAVKRLKLTLLEDLIDAKAPLNVPERNSGRHPLHLAVDCGDLEIVEALLQNGADPNAVAMDGNTPLHIAVLKKHEPIIVRLLKAGANPDLKTAYFEHKEALADNELESDEHMDDEMLEAEIEQEQYSPREMAGNNARLTKLLDGELLQPLFLAGSSSPEQEDHKSRKPAEIENTGFHENENTPSSSNSDRRSSGFCIPAAAMQDDLASLDFVTRLRLSKLLDTNGAWQRLARSLKCEHMIEFLGVCTEADESSPTILLLDQYEQIPGATVTTLVESLEALGEAACLRVLAERKMAGMSIADSRENLQDMDED